MAHVTAQPGALSPENAARIKTTLLANRLPVDCPYDADALVRCAASDKKIRGGSIFTVLIRDVGDCFLQPMSLEDLRKLL